MWWEEPSNDRAASHISDGLLPLDMKLPEEGMTSVLALDCPHHVSQRLGLSPRRRERKPPEAWRIGNGCRHWWQPCLEHLLCASAGLMAQGLVHSTCGTCSSHTCWLDWNESVNEWLRLGGRLSPGDENPDH